MTGEYVLQEEMAAIYARVKERRKDYIDYDFTRKKNDILKTFFDLTQEYGSLSDLYRVCVAVPFEFMGLHSRLYLIEEKTQALELVCDSRQGLVRGTMAVPEHIILAAKPYERENSFVVPIIRRQYRDREFAVLRLSAPIMGALEIFPADLLTFEDRFFFTKYANRIGYNIYNRIIDRQNIRHIKFINNLVRDIEHNVIVPNMFFKYLFRQLRKKIEEMAELEEEVGSLLASGDRSAESCRYVRERIATLQQDLDNYLREVEKHHSNQSLFLESLFRRDHFEQGHLVLRPKPCMVDREIIQPQLEHYRKQLAAQGITVRPPHDLIHEEIPLAVDIGLIAQVYANFFSNAVKYTEEVDDPVHGPTKVLAYGREYLANYFGAEKDGVKFNIFTTGRHLAVEERKIVFASGFRCKKDEQLPGSGHGLAFVKNVVEMHGGEVGYEPTEQGNNFFFILPLPPRNVTDDLDGPDPGDGRDGPL